jgi:hypothetical protein
MRASLASCLLRLLIRSPEISFVALLHAAHLRRRAILDSCLFGTSCLFASAHIQLNGSWQRGLCRCARCCRATHFHGMCVRTTHDLALAILSPQQRSAALTATPLYFAAWLHNAFSLHRYARGMRLTLRWRTPARCLLHVAWRRLSVLRPFLPPPNISLPV